MRRYAPVLTVVLYALLSCTTAPPTDTVAVAETDQEPAESFVESLPEEEDVYSSISAAMVVGDVDQAISAFEEAYSEDPEDIETRLLYSNLLLAAGEIQEAKAVVEGILIDEPEHTDALYNLSLIEGLLGNEELQEEILITIVGIDENHARAHASLGEIRLRNNLIDEARASFETSLQLEPDNIVALMGYGNTLVRAAEPEQAIDQFTRVIDLVPDYVFAYVDRSRAHMEAEDYLAAEEDLSTAIELDPDYYWHYIDRGRMRLLAMRDPDGALEDFNRAVAIDGDYFYAYVYRGGILDQKDRREEAISDYLKVLDSRPDYFYIYAPLGVLLYMEERWPQAVEYLSKAYDYQDEEHLFAFLIALAMRRDDNNTDAVAYLREAVEAFPRESLYYKLARIFFDHGAGAFVAGEVSKEKNTELKMQALFVLATHYLIIGEPVIAQRYYLEVEEKAYPGTPERRIATRELEQYRD